MAKNTSTTGAEPKSANIITPPFRGSFVHLAKPRAAAPDAPEKYSMMVVLPTSDPECAACLTRLQEACNAAALAKFGGKLPKKLRLPFRDGDMEDNRPEWAGSVVFPVSASVEFRPQVVDKDLNEIIDPAELYSGAWYRVSLRAYAWDNPVGGKGVSLGLVNVQKLRDDEPFSGGVKAADEFAAWSDE